MSRFDDELDQLVENELDQLNDDELEYNELEEDEFEEKLGKQNSRTNDSTSKQSSSMAKLQREIATIISKTGDDEVREQKIRNKIENFPVPNTKEDLFEFTVSSLSKIGDDSEFRSSYEAKYLECISKAEILFPNDPLFIGVANKYKEVKKAIIKKYIRLGLFVAALFVLFAIICLIGMMFD